VTFRRTVALAILVVISTVSRAAETPQTSLLILGKSDQSLSIVDPGSLQVIARLPSGPDPHEVIASGDGKFAYISNYGGGTFNTITVVDLVAQKLLPVIDLGALRGPHGLAFSRDKLWFTAEGAKVVGSYDPATEKIDWVLGTGQDRTHMVYVFPGEDKLITSNVSSATVTFIQKESVPARGPGGPGGPPRTEWNETVIPVGKGAEGFDVTPDGREIWVANAQDGTISIIDVATKKVVQTLDANIRGANRLKFTPDGKLAFVSTLRGSDLRVLDRANRKEVKRIKLGHGAAGILMQPDGARVYVACTPDNYVAVIDLKSLEVTGKITAGKNPDGLAWAVSK
jgi:YVTN family beta-propeller protein